MNLHYLWLLNLWLAVSTGDVPINNREAGTYRPYDKEDYENDYLSPPSDDYEYGNEYEDEYDYHSPQNKKLKKPHSGHGSYLNPHSLHNRPSNKNNPWANKNLAENGIPVILSLLKKGQPSKTANQKLHQPFYDLQRENKKVIKGSFDRKPTLSFESQKLLSVENARRNTSSPISSQIENSKQIAAYKQLVKLDNDRVGSRKNESATKSGASNMVVTRQKESNVTKPNGVPDGSLFTYEQILKLSKKLKIDILSFNRKIDQDNSYLETHDFDDDYDEDDGGEYFSAKSVESTLESPDLYLPSEKAPHQKMLKPAASRLSKSNKGELKRKNTETDGLRPTAQQMKASQTQQQSYSSFRRMDGKFSENNLGVESIKKGLVGIVTIQGSSGRQEKKSNGINDCLLCRDGTENNHQHPNIPQPSWSQLGHYTA